MQELPNGHTPPTQINPFNEEEWLRMIFAISDLHQWLDEVSKGIIHLVPGHEKRKLFRKAYYITAPVLAHILERHFYKVMRHPGTGKFTITIPEIFHYLREGFHAPSSLIAGTTLFKRTVNTGTTTGIDRTGNSTTIMTIITDAAGKICTAYPGHQ